jgi:hypothetical protein
MGSPYMMATLIFVILPHDFILIRLIEDFLKDLVPALTDT